MDRGPCHSHHTARRIELDLPEPELAGRVSVGTPETTHYGMNSCLELATENGFDR
jgi:hypothetical protein